MTGMALIRTISSQELRQRIREVRQGPDGFLSLLTDHVDAGARQLHEHGTVGCPRRHGPGNSPSPG